MKPLLIQTLRTTLTASVVLMLTACPSHNSDKSDNKPHTQTANTAKPKAVVALALGGGASKGFAHIGIIKVLKENNIPVKVVTGTSAGSIVGSLYASGMSPDRLELEAEILGKTDLVDLTLSSSGFIKGEKLQNYINYKVGNRSIQQFPIKFAAVATDFESGKAVAFNRGNVGQAVRASASIPNVFQPAVIGGPPPRAVPVLRRLPGGPRGGDVSRAVVPGDGARLRHDHLVAGITDIRAVRGHRARIVSRCE